MSRSRSGFTLIELLVVIAIIAILAAILFPVFAQVREKARQTTCASNEKQIGLAIAQYIQDYDETLPLANHVVNGTQFENWQYDVDPYVKGGYPQDNHNLAVGSSAPHLSVWFCPSWDRTHDQFYDDNATPAGTAASDKATPSKSYLLNENYTYADVGGVGIFSKPSAAIAQFKTPSQTVIVTEGRGNTVNTSGNDTATGPANGVLSTDFGNYVSGRARHTGGGNYLFVDGHVKFVKAPGTNRNPDGTPVTASTGVVYSQAQYPNAVGWFLEDPTAS